MAEVLEEIDQALFKTALIDPEIRKKLEFPEKIEQGNFEDAEDLTEDLTNLSIQEITEICKEFLPGQRIFPACIFGKHHGVFCDVARFIDALYGEIKKSGFSDLTELKNHLGIKSAAARTEVATEEAALTQKRVKDALQACTIDVVDGAPTVDLAKVRDSESCREVLGVVVDQPKKLRALISKVLGNMVGIVDSDKKIKPVYGLVEIKSYVENGTPIPEGVYTKIEKFVSEHSGVDNGDWGKKKILGMYVLYQDRTELRPLGAALCGEEFIYSAPRPDYGKNDAIQEAKGRMNDVKGGKIRSDEFSPSFCNYLVSISPNRTFSCLAIEKFLRENNLNPGNVVIFTRKEERAEGVAGQHLETAKKVLKKAGRTTYSVSDFPGSFSSHVRGLFPGGFDIALLGFLKKNGKQKLLVSLKYIKADNHKKRIKKVINKHLKEAEEVLERTPENIFLKDFSRSFYLYVLKKNPRLGFEKALHKFLESNGKENWMKGKKFVRKKRV